MVKQFIKELLRGVFFSYASVGTWFGIICSIWWWFFPKYSLGDRMDTIIAAIALPYRLLILLGFVFISVILTSYSMYKKQQQTIDELSGNGKDVKQKIRTFLESINPLILQKIDAGEKKIVVSITPDTSSKLGGLSQQPDFDKFLSYEWSGYVGDSSAIDDLSHTGHIKPQTQEYYFCLKDALKK